MKKWFGAVATGLLGLFFFQISCTHEYIENINPVCFEAEVLPLFQSNCTQSGCHNSTDREKGYDFSNYSGILKGVEAGNYRKSEVYKVLVLYGGGEAMPPKPYQRLSDDQIATIALWIEQGAQNTSGCQSSSGCDTTNVTFSGSVKPILETYCNGCHSGSAPSGGISYSTHAGTLPTAQSGSLVGAIQHSAGYSAMPQGGNKLSDCQINKIKKWVALGAKND
jgi:mono/diheme cytochrome c family protein